MANTRKMLAADMWSIWHFGNPNERFADFLSQREASAKRFIESLVVQDKVFIPTDDYMSLAIVLSLFGERGLLPLIEEDALGFVRVKGAMMYVGNGGGLRSGQLWRKEGPMHPFCAPMDEAIDWALSGLTSKFSRSAVSNAALNASVEISVDIMNDQTRRETLADIAASSELRESCNLPTSGIDALPGIGPRSGQPMRRSSVPCGAVLNAMTPAAARL